MSKSFFYTFRRSEKINLPNKTYRTDYVCIHGTYQIPRSRQLRLDILTIFPIEKSLKVLSVRTEN